MDPDEGLFDETDLDRLARLQDGLVAFATGGSFPGETAAYQELRRHFATRADTKGKLPEFIRRCRDLSQFWNFIQPKHPTYRERRTFIWEEFRPLVGHLPRSVP